MILRNRSLLALLAAELVSRLGSQMTFLALPWFVLVTTHSPTKMGVVLAVELLPTALLEVPSGTLVARFGARSTMLGADVMRVPLMASLPILHAVGALSFPLLLVLGAAFGCFNPRTCRSNWGRWRRAGGNVVPAPRRAAGAARERAGSSPRTGSAASSER